MNIFKYLTKALRGSTINSNTAVGSKPPETNLKPTKPRLELPDHIFAMVYATMLEEGRWNYICPTTANAGLLIAEDTITGSTFTKGPCYWQLNLDGIPLTDEQRYRAYDALETLKERNEKKKFVDELDALIAKYV